MKRPFTNDLLLLMLPSPLITPTFLVRKFSEHLCLLIRPHTYLRNNFLTQQKQVLLINSIQRLGVKPNPRKLFNIRLILTDQLISCIIYVK